MTINVTKYRLNPDRIFGGTRGSYGMEKLSFDFGDGWDFDTISVTFHPQRGKPIRVPLLPGEEIDIPAEVMEHSGETRFVVSGRVIGEDGAIERQAITLEGYVDVAYTADEKGGNTRKITPDVYDQLIDQASKVFNEAREDVSRSVEDAAESASDAEGFANSAEKNANAAKASAEQATEAAKSASDAKENAVREVSSAADQALRDIESAGNEKIGEIESAADEAEAAAARAKSSASSASSASMSAMDYSNQASRHSATASVYAGQARTSASNAETSANNAAASKDAAETASEEAKSAAERVKEALGLYPTITLTPLTVAPGMPNAFRVTVKNADGTIQSETVENGVNGITPHIGTNGNWYIGDTDTGVFAGGGSGGGISQETDPTVPDWAKQPEKPTYTADEVGAASTEDVERLSKEITDKADKTLTSADGDSWEVAVEDGGDVVTHKTGGVVEIVAESLKSATLSDKVLTLTGITGTYGAVIIPDASEISIDVPANVEKNPYFADPAGWQNPSFGWFFLRTDSGYIAVHTTNYAEVYTVSVDLKTWTSIGGAVSNVAQNTMRVVLDNGTATVYSDDVATYTVNGIAGIGYAASSVKVLTIYGVTVIHRQSGGSEADLSEVNNRIDTLDNRKMDKYLTSPDGTKWVLSVGNDGTVTATKYTGEAIPATGIALNPATLLFEDSANKMITATLTPVDSTDTVVWKSSNDGIVTVSGGKVTPIANGTATITATAGSVSATCEVTVNIAAGEATTYSITRNITNAVGFDDSTTIGEGSELLECYISADECTMDGATATVTMGGEDITKTAWDNGVVNIAEVTGDVVITLDAVKINYVVPPIEDFTVDPHTNYTLLTAYNGSETAIEIPGSGTVNGVETSFEFSSFSAGNAKHIKIPETLQHYTDGKIAITGDKLLTVDGNGNNYSYSPSQNAVFEKPLSNGGKSYKRCYAIRTLQGVTYPETMTSMSALYQQCTSLVHGGVIPAQVTNLNKTFYGCTELRKIRMEARGEFTNIADAFYNVKNLEMELYSDSAYWSSVRSSVGTPNKNTYKFIDDAVFNPIICIGDSLTSDSYPDSLNTLAPTNARVYRSSQGGYTSQQIYDSKMMIDTVKPWLFDSIVVIWHGTNGYGTDGYDGVTAKMVAALGGNERYLLIPPTAQGVGDEVYESWVATYGAEHVLSIGDWFVNNSYTVSEYQTDGTHFTADGYALVAQAVYEKISVWL